MESHSADTVNKNVEKADIKGDRLNFVLLTFLYFLQGSIIGIGEAIPIVLQKRGASYEDQAALNLIWHPFSLKILVAPIVDSIYCKKIGRRKSWMILTQYSIGALLFFVSMNVDDWMGSEEGTRKPNVGLLVVILSICMLLSSIQDIVVDGWSLTILQKKNIAHTAISQSIGSSLGNIVTYTTFIVLDSKKFCNYFRSVPQERGFVTFAEFLTYLSIVFIVTVTLVLVFKKENCDESNLISENGDDLTITGTYVLLYKILKLRSIQLLGLFLLTRFISSAPTYTVAPLKLVDSGISEDNLALLTIFSFPLQLFLPLLLNRRATGSKPMHLFLVFYVLRMIAGAFYTVFIFFTSSPNDDANDVSRAWYYWVLLVLFYNFENLALLIMMMTVGVVFARISDPRFGGVYMTLLNSITNVGESWSSYVCLRLVNLLTVEACNVDTAKNITCYTMVDGFYTEVVLCTLIGLIWICWGKKYIYQLEEMDSQTCLVEQESDIVKAAITL